MAEVKRITGAEVHEAVSVLCDAFQDYPVMRFVLGSEGNYVRRLYTLVGFFVAARVFRDEPVLGIREPDGRLAAAAIVSLPGEQSAPEGLAVRREEVWAELGQAERARYEAYGVACAPFEPEPPHHHLNMIGVRRSHMGQGLARALLETVHRMSDDDEGSAGVSLTTEVPENLPFYQHFGYRIMGQATVAGAYDSWTFYREARRL